MLDGLGGDVIENMDNIVRNGGGGIVVAWCITIIRLI